MLNLIRREHLIKLMDLLLEKESSNNKEKSIYKPSEVTQIVRENLVDFQIQRDFPGLDWQGIEMLCYKLAEVIKSISVETTGWYKYSSSTRFDQDGKNWRYVCSSCERPVIINCHSLLHDNVWTLNTTIFDTTQIDLTKLKPISHDDVWKRSMLWVIETAKILQTNGFNYSEPLKDFSERLSAVDDLYGIEKKLELQIKETFKKLFHRESQMPKISIGINTWNLKRGKIAMYSAPGIITISPKALKKKDYLRWVLMHELIHCAFGDTCEKENSHHKNFIQMATVLGLPKQFQD